HAAWNPLQAAGQGHAACKRTGSRRPVCDRPCRGAKEIDERTETHPRGIEPAVAAGKTRRRGRYRGQAVLRTRQRYLWVSTPCWTSHLPWAQGLELSRTC